MQMHNDFSYSNKYLIKGTVLNGRFLIENTLGEGGFSITYRALHIDMQKPVAIKEFFVHDYMYRDSRISNNIKLVNESDTERLSKDSLCFLNEARILSEVSAIKGIVQVTDYFQENETAYIVMELVEGNSLENILENGTKLSWDEAIRKTLPLMKALTVLHKKGLIHQDIKPANILISEYGEYTLIDFGAAFHFVEDETHSVYLTDGYAPKEQYLRNGKLGPYTDVYAICALIYHCVTGIIPENSIQRSVFDELKRPSELGIQIPKGIENAIMKGLQINPEQRWKTMNDLYLEIVSQLPRQKKPNILLYTLSGALLAICTFAILFFSIKYPEIRIHYMAKNNETISVRLDVPKEMTAYEFDHAIESVKGRVKTFAGNNNYSIDIETTNITITVPKDCFDKQDEWEIDEIIDICFAFSGKWILVAKEGENLQKKIISSDNITEVELNYGGLPILTNSGNLYEYIGHPIDWSTMENYYLTICFDEDTADFIKEYLSISGYQFYSYIYFDDNRVLGYDWISAGNGKTAYFPIISSKEGGKRLAETILYEMSTQNYSDNLILSMPESE